jgi:hypothetical protein
MQYLFETHIPAPRLLATAIHWAILGWIYSAGTKIKSPGADFVYGA